MTKNVVGYSNWVGAIAEHFSDGDMNMLNAEEFAICTALDAYETCGWASIDIVDLLEALLTEAKKR